MTTIRAVVQPQVRARLARYVVNQITGDHAVWDVTTYTATITGAQVDDYQIAYDPDTEDEGQGRVYRLTGDGWVLVGTESGDSIQQAGVGSFSDPADGIAVGVTLIDTDDDNAPYEWDGSDWAALGSDLTVAQRLAIGMTGAELYDLIEAGTVTPDLNTCTLAKSGSNLRVTMDAGERMTIAFPALTLGAISDLTHVGMAMHVQQVSVSGSAQDWALGCAAHAHADDIDYSDDAAQWVGLVAGLTTDTNLTAAAAAYQESGGSDRVYASNSSGASTNAASDTIAGTPRIQISAALRMERQDPARWRARAFGTGGADDAEIGDAYSPTSSALNCYHVIAAHSDGDGTQVLDIERVWAWAAGEPA